MHCRIYVYLLSQLKTLTSLSQLIAGHSVLTFCGLAVLYKLRANSGNATTATPETGRVATPLLPELAAMLLYVAGEAAIFGGGGAVYAYGARRFRATPASRDARASRSGAFDSSSSKSPLVSRAGYRPHAVAVGCLAVAALLRAPLFYDCVMCYRRTGGVALLWAACGDCALLVAWVSAWLLMTLKRRWSIRGHEYRVDKTAGNGTANKNVWFDGAGPPPTPPRPLAPPPTPHRPLAPPTVSETAGAVKSRPRHLPAVDYGMEGGNGLFRLRADSRAQGTPRLQTHATTHATTHTASHVTRRPEDSVAKRYRNDLRSCCDNYYCYRGVDESYHDAPPTSLAAAPHPPRAASSADVYAGRGFDRRGFEGRGVDLARRPLSTGYLPRLATYVSPTYVSPSYVSPSYGAQRIGTGGDRDIEEQEEEEEAWPLDNGSLDSNDVLCSRV